MILSLFYQYSKSILISPSTFHWTDISPTDMVLTGNDTTTFFIRSGTPIFETYNISCNDGKSESWWTPDPPPNQNVYSMMLNGFKTILFQTKFPLKSSKPIEGWKIPSGICNLNQSFYLPFIPNGVFSLTLQDQDPPNGCIFVSDNSNLTTNVRFSVSGDSYSSSYTQTTLSGIPTPRETLKDSSRRGEVTNGVFIKLNSSGNSKLQIAFRHRYSKSNKTQFQAEYYDECQINPVYLCTKAENYQCNFTDSSIYLNNLISKCSYNWILEEHILMIIFIVLVQLAAIIIIVLLIVRNQYIKHIRKMFKKALLHQSITSQ